jgi:twinkle protein
MRPQLVRGGTALASNPSRDAVAAWGCRRSSKSTCGTTTAKEQLYCRNASRQLLLFGSSQSLLSAASQLHPRHSCTITITAIARRHKSVFVSKHNQSLNVTVQDIIEHVPTTHHSSHHRVTATHVILQECPFCSKATQNEPDNQYKLYVQLSSGAYFCHRCGTGGSWFDFKACLGGSNTEARFHNFLQRKPTSHTIPCLPMPSPRLQALYSTNLLDANPPPPTTTTASSLDTTNNSTTDHDSPIAALDYLHNTRGLERGTLRRYGVGFAHYSFPSGESRTTTSGFAAAAAWVQAPCITFPWIMTVADIAYQEDLRGAKFLYEDPNGAPAVGVPIAPEVIQKRSRGRPRLGSPDNPTNNNKNNKEPATTTPTIFLTRRIKARALQSKAWQRLDPPGGGWGIFGYHTIPANTKELVVTEGEYDAMAVWQATGRAAVSLPNGCRSLPVDVLPLLEEFDKIYLWMDNDAPGQAGAELFGKKIGLDRCFVVRPTKENTGCDTEQDLPKDANDALLKGLDLDWILNDAKVVPHAGILSFNDLRSDVLLEIMYPEKYVGIPLPSLPKLTHLIKGLQRGELTVLTGATGSGKTTLLGQLSLDLAEQDVNVLWGSFEIKNTRLIHELLQQFAREPLPAGDPAVAHKLELIADSFERLPLHFLKFHDGSDVDDVLDAMDYAVYVNDVEHIILDNMQFMFARGKSMFDKFDDVAIEKFRKFATDRNIHIILVVHPRKQDEDTKLSISSIYGSAKATQEADNVLILQLEGGKKYLDIRKNRFNGELGQMELFFDRQSCRYTEVPPFNSNNPEAVPTITIPTIANP